MDLKEEIRAILKRRHLNPDNDFLYRIANVESNGGKHLKQLGGGPGRGYYQYEMWVAIDVIYRLKLVMPPRDVLEDLLTFDLEWQTVLARRHLYTWPEAIPKDLEGQAHYWKKKWNTRYGKGTVAHFLAKNEGK